MKRANRFMLIAGVLLAAVAFVAVLAFGGGNAQTPAQPHNVDVVVAVSDLPLGTELTVDNLTTQSRSQSEAQGTYQRPDELLGQVVRRTVPAGQALTSADFETTDNPQIAQSLQPGQRAMAVPLSNVDAVDGLLQPGDRVDALISMKDTDDLNPIVVNNPNAGTDGGATDPYILIDTYLNNTTVKVVVQNVQVLAVTANSTQSSNANSHGVPEPDFTIVLAVSPQQSEIVRYGQLDGNISLVLRAPGDNTAADVTTTGITLRWLVDNYGVLPPQPVTP